MERAARREQVLGCAVKVFSQRGYHATTVSDIIEEAGVARGTFYLYFKSKRAIFDELLDEYLKQILGQFPRVDTSPQAEPPVRQMLGNVERVLGVLLDSQELTRILLHEAVGLDADFDRKLGEFYGQLVSLTERSLGLGQQMGLVRPCDVRVAALCIVGALKEVVDRAASCPESLPERSVLAGELLRVVLGGVFRPSALEGLPGPD
jgi:AcrR family transcriptional regulator